MLSPVILTTSSASATATDGGDYFSPRRYGQGTKSAKPITPRFSLSSSPTRQRQSSPLAPPHALNTDNVSASSRRALAATMSYYPDSSNGAATAPYRPDSHLSSVAPRAPLPGYDRDYRNPGAAAAVAEEGDAWGPTSPPRGGAHNTWGNGGGGGGATNHFPTSGQPTLVPRSPQTIEPSRRVSAATDAEYGPPEPASSSSAATSNNPHHQQHQAKEGFIRIRILGIDRQKKDMYIKFNAETNLPNFHHSSYRSLSRSYTEFSHLVSALSVTCPQSIVPALPLSQTSAATDEEDDRLIKVAFQKWAVRVTSDPAAIRDDETRSFIESDFGYTPRAKKKSSAGFSFSRSSRLPGEIEDPLTAAKVSMARLETVFNDTSKTLDRVSKARRTAASAVHDLGEQCNVYALAESYQPLAHGFKKLSNVLKMDADLLASQSVSEQITLGDVFLYQSGNAKSAKDTLSGRDAVADDHRQAVKASIQKRRNIEKLKSASSLRSDKVNEALEDLDEAQHYEETLARRLQGISTNLQPSLTRHSVDTHTDLLQSLLEHARTTLIYEKQRLKEYENMRPEMRAIRKPEAGVIYHTAPAQVGSNMGRQGSVGSVASSGTASGPLSASASTYGGGGGPPGTPTPAGRAGASQPPPPSSAGGVDPLAARASSASAEHARSMAQKVEKRSIRNMASSVHVEGDKRQRVDARMAASMLANGF
ncbi:hypothetical protein JCM10908_001324 [Rhodotorula pacifica]|uniref:retromer subunit VPS17 n=1 Tax=Rhodotorula pacifica TaxID=1495444 RepID=UPI003179D200